MRTPLSNIESYTYLLEDTVENALTGDIEDEQIDWQYREQILTLEESEKKLHFPLDSFVKMARLEHHVIQIRKN